EASDGIKKIATAQHPMFGRYFTLLRRANALFPAINICPGSPWLMAQLLRPHDKLVLCEKHPDDFLLLKKNMPAWPNIQLHHRDAYEAMGALLPPHEPRGFVLIDPPFEQADEWQKIHAALQKSAKKFSHAVCALWYPIKDRTTTQRHVETIANMGWKKIMLAEFIYAPPQRSDRLNGCGMLLINAPWQLDQWLTALIPALHQALQQPNCGSLVEVMGES
ncbi:MAG: 23S rRNA (adenine(2030)-N(6))-methyltransferase RlmJ, partial [Alphaproteobacteria bacterium]|nr:23S rRNA (adenine(2030)-N(6))-methyltransferase RlmJ [Alphaproteobacteria bacterium]